MMAVEDLHFSHRQSLTSVLKGVTFAAERGKLTAVLGANGSGKTTLFRCITGLWKPQKGDISFEGKSIRDFRHSERARIIALVPQEHEPPFPYSVLEAVIMGRVVHVGLFSNPSRHDRRKAEEAVERVGIGHLRSRPYTKISGGERQLVLIARALAQESPVRLLDEPTSHLDFKNQILVLRKIKEIVQEKAVTALMTIHDPNLATLFSDNVVMLNDGCVLSQGAPHEVVNEHNLSGVYGIDVCVFAVNGSRVIMPRMHPQ
jgi:iron complex transport system ATP-binding protein